MAADKEEEMAVSPLSCTPEIAYKRMYIKQTVNKITPMDLNTPIFKDKIRFVCLSDTHSLTNDISFIPPGDVLLHAGDFTKIGMPQDIIQFNNFLGTQDHPVKVVIAGNHEATFDDDCVKSMEEHQLIFQYLKYCKDYLEANNLESVKDLLTNCVYLENSSVNICGIKIYGTPTVPKFCHMGFNVNRGQPILDRWNQIPHDTTILMTHGPPLGRGDLCVSQKRAGCVDLLNTVQKRVQPKVHLFGHIHEGYGITSDGHTMFINASNCNVRYQCRNPPTIFDIPVPDGHSKEELQMHSVILNTDKP